MSNDTEPTICQRCHASLEDGYSTHYNPDGSIKEYTCLICSRQQTLDEYAQTGELRSSLVSNATVARMYITGECQPDRLRSSVLALWQRNGAALLAIAAASDDISYAARKFERLRWLGGLQQLYRGSEARGWSGSAGDFKALMWGSAGRVLIQLEDVDRRGKYGGARVTLIFDEESPTPRGGVQGLAATRDEALSLIAAATERMPTMLPDKEVTIGV